MLSPLMLRHAYHPASLAANRLAPVEAFNAHALVRAAFRISLESKAAACTLELALRHVLASKVALELLQRAKLQLAFGADCGHPIALGICVVAHCDLVRGSPVLIDGSKRLEALATLEARELAVGRAGLTADAIEHVFACGS
jgi:hypothetical protein